jgi:glucosyl-3-phosphoglycerate synthase
VSGIATMVAAGLVDELLVVDGGSTDRTRAVAVASGAQVIDLLDHMPGEPYPGKGGALWLSLQHTSGDVLLFLDADVAPFAPGWVPAMVEPLLATAEVMLVKGCYARPVGEPGRIVPGRGGRVTELVARPLLALFWPELAGIRQPLAGETAARRSLLQSLPFASGYGVEIGLLLDSYARHGLDAIAQVDLGVRWHAPQEDDALARMSAVVLHAAMRRVMPHESTTTLLMGERLWQYVGAGDDGSVAYDIPHRDFLPHVP